MYKALGRRQSWLRPGRQSQSRQASRQSCLIGVALEVIEPPRVLPLPGPSSKPPDRAICVVLRR
jgi:hypothetical protein